MTTNDTKNISIILVADSILKERASSAANTFVVFDSTFPLIQADTKCIQFLP